VHVGIIWQQGYTLKQPERKWDSNPQEKIPHQNSIRMSTVLDSGARLNHRHFCKRRGIGDVCWHGENEALPGNAELGPERWKSSEKRRSGIG
jgi:ABC-type sulfate transport system substrate-binding protein